MGRNNEDAEVDADEDGDTSFQDVGHSPKSLA